MMQLSLSSYEFFSLFWYRLFCKLLFLLSYLRLKLFTKLSLSYSNRWKLFKIYFSSIRAFFLCFIVIIWQDSFIILKGPLALLFHLLNYGLLLIFFTLSFLITRLRFNINSIKDRMRQNNFFNLLLTLSLTFEKNFFLHYIRIL